MTYGTEKVHCGICGKEYDAMVLDGHISYPHICNDCMRDIVNEWYVHGIPICDELKLLINNEENVK